ncbi:C40 family peptidase [Blastococcus sp. TML/M2B]|uniref:C40 family peptidase n=1 Tax=unclassified Blastococcus TaxID=2619396 RepID=UPI00190C2D21|nr:MULTISPECIES: C40 family peptidase [unclassified Blastococcus]MBN1093646.1 C40 family peptidase [Blastococcus sp. TML/M2B]MBN1096234.1 C40 family peptidase [Blastococcus sp. TML/C7B]
MVTTRPNLQNRTLRRTGAGLLTGAAASLGLLLTPATAVAAEPAPAPAAEAPAPAPSAAQVAVDTALAQVGKPYVYGGGGPDSFDCSGLTQFAYAAAGISLPHSSKGQSQIGVPIAPLDLQPGDLVFYYSPVSHVGIYIGDGQIVHAGTEATGVEITTVSMDGYNYATRIA